MTGSVKSLRTEEAALTGESVPIDNNDEIELLDDAIDAFRAVPSAYGVFAHAHPPIFVDHPCVECFDVPATVSTHLCPRSSPQVVKSALPMTCRSSATKAHPTHPPETFWRVPTQPGYIPNLKVGRDRMAEWKTPATSRASRGGDNPTMRNDAASLNDK